jgi:hypothetical protein
MSGKRHHSHLGKQIIRQKRMMKRRQQRSALELDTFDRRPNNLWKDFVRR